MTSPEEILARSERYAAAFAKGGLPASPALGLAIVTCMDARLDPAKFLALEEGEAHVIRNAGGLVTDDALRSLVISHWLLGTRRALVVAHTDCGMLTFTNEQLRGKLAREAGADADELDFLPFTDLEESVRASVRRIRESPLLPGSFSASGALYDVRTGRVREVL